jgi:hypothetical protein
MTQNWEGVGGGRTGAFHLVGFTNNTGAICFGPLTMRRCRRKVDGRRGWDSECDRYVRMSLRFMPLICGSRRQVVMTSKVARPGSPMAIFMRVEISESCGREIKNSDNCGPAVTRCGKLALK